MTFFERLEILINKNNTSLSKLCTTLGLNKNTAYAWRDRGNTPKGDTINKIAEYLNTTAAYLLGETDDPAPPDEIEDNFAASMPMGYDELTDDEKAELRELAEVYIKNRKK